MPGGQGRVRPLGGGLQGVTARFVQNRTLTIANDRSAPAWKAQPFDNM